MNTARPEVLVLGIGNASRGDDAVGLVVANRVGEQGLPGIAVRACPPDGMALLDEWQGMHSVVIIDAATSNVAPGTITRFEAGDQALPAKAVIPSTHMFGVVQAIELARTLGRLPKRVTVFAIEGASFDHGAELSPAVERAVDDAVQRVVEEVTAQNN